MNNERFQELSERLRKKAVQQGLKLELLMATSKQFSCSYQRSKMDRYESNQQQCLGIRLLRDNAEATAFSESLEKGDVDGLFAGALEDLSVANGDESSPLLDPQSYEPLQLFEASISETPIAAKKEIAKSLDESLFAADSRITAAPDIGYEDFESEISIATTAGVEGSYRKNGCQLYAAPLAKQDSQSAMSIGEQARHRFGDLSVHELVNEIKNRVLQKLEVGPIKSGYYDVLIPPRVGQKILSLFATALNGKSVAENSSFLGGRLGQPVVHPNITLRDDPYYPLAFGSRPFDSEGAASQKTNIISQGVLNTYITNSVYAKKLNLKNTANAKRSPRSSLGIGFSNLVLESGSHSYDSLLNWRPQVLVLDQLSGLHAGFDSVSGDFSLQAEGFLYGNGQFQHAVKDFVISGNIVELLQNVEAVGNDPYLSTHFVITPSLAAAKVSVAGS